MDAARSSFLDGLRRALRIGFRLALILLCVTGLGATMASTLAGRTGAVLVAGIVRFFFYFTIQSTLAVTFWLASTTFSRRGAESRMASRHPDPAGPGVHLALLSSSVLTAGGYHLLLAGVWNPTGLAAFGNLLVHGAVPAMFALDWLLFERKGTFRFRHVAGVFVLPGVHLALSLARGAVTGEYPYPFLDPVALGAGPMVRNTVALALCLFVGSALLVAFDAALGGIARSRRREGERATP